MKLNPDCVRDILIECENLCTPTSDVMFNSQNTVCNGVEYSFDELAYHLRQCDMNGFFYKYKQDITDNYVITDITPKAHEFLENMRSSGLWENAKTVAKKIGATSLSALIQIANGILSEVIKAQLKTSGII